ncbi:hypothetical protein [Rhizobium sp. Rhizsp82]|uniref:hypothetical protein n=1 Tax=Rhizobium sp. Rhizsp82 TaxID=3243057 RepID=UPI0039B554B7
MDRSVIYLRTEWDNGSPTYVVTLPDISDEQRRGIEGVVDEEGFVRNGVCWRPAGDAKLYRLFEAVRSIGFDLNFQSDPDGPFNLHRLHLRPETRSRLEQTESFRLDELAGFCPVQAEGEFDGLYFYFRARGAHWRFEAGGDAIGNKCAVWWYEEAWPSPTGFEAGYMSDDDAIQCILKAIDFHRFTDRSRFEKSHPDYERTTLEGWSLGALSLANVLERLSVTAEEVITRLDVYGIERPYFADLELKAIATKTGADQVAANMPGVSPDHTGEDDW